MTTDRDSEHSGDMAEIKKIQYYVVIIGLTILITGSLVLLWIMLSSNPYEAPL